MKGCEYLLKLFCDYFDCLDDGFDVLCCVVLCCALLVGVGLEWGQNRYEKDGEVRNEKLKMDSGFLLFDVNGGLEIGSESFGCCNSWCSY